MGIPFRFYKTMEMTKLEEEIKKEIETSSILIGNGTVHEDDYIYFSRVAAKVAKRWIEKALNDANERLFWHGHPEIIIEKWLKENGIV
jgi:Ni,Fe-hydrogenase I small subunit